LNERLAALARLAFLNRDPHFANMSIASKSLKKDSTTLKLRWQQMAVRVDPLPNCANLISK
jgi:hypothetical protein